MTLVPTIDGIGFNEMDRDLEKGDDLLVSMQRACETFYDDPTKFNRKRVAHTMKALEDYTEMMAKKYDIDL